LASSNLPNSEQLGGGGVGSARGYHSDTALGSKGLLFSQEFKLPPISLAGPGGASAKSGQLQFGLFFDFAKLQQNTIIPYQENDVELASVGGNAHYSLGRRLDFQLELGYRLTKTLLEPQRGILGHISVTAGF
jgi:hemolysin activation/secretion protein